MTVVGIMDTLTDWVRENICTKIQLKVPPDSETDATDEGYAYRLVNPAAFTLYVPTKEKLVKDDLHPALPVSPFPSVCVRFMEGADDLAGGEYSAQRSIGIQLCFSAWDPGTHGKDVILPNLDNPMEPKRWTAAEADEYFHRNGDGWRDAWNMVDVALREIESVTNIDGILIDRSVPVKFGPLSEQEAIPDYYPFWFSWVSFTVINPITRNIRDIQEFL